MIERVPELSGQESTGEIERKIRILIDRVYDLWPQATKITRNEQAYQRCVDQGRSVTEILALFELVQNWNDIKSSNQALGIYTAYAQYAEKLLELGK